MDADSIRGIPVGLPPANPFAQKPMPSGDTCDDLGLFLDPRTGTVNWKRVSIACGPSSLNINLPIHGRQLRALIGPVGQYGMRDGLAAYIPRGVWNLSGILVVAGPTDVQYDVQVWQGHTPSLDPARPGIVSESPVPVGGGVGTWSGAANKPFGIPFCADMIQFAGADDQANEITVTVYAHCSGDAGAALGVIPPDGLGGPGVYCGYVSRFMIHRVRGF